MSEQGTELLSSSELKAIGLTAELAELFVEIVESGAGRSRRGDLQEAVMHIHALQRMLMSQAAARAYPKVLRLLGGEPVLGVEE